MTQHWTSDELDTADLGDKRLNERFQTILEAFADRPTASIPAACGGRIGVVRQLHFGRFHEKQQPERNAAH